MKEREHFNPYDHFAGCFLPHWLLSLTGLSAGSKLCYSLLAQQASARGTAQLNLPLLASATGEATAQLVGYLQELEKRGLIVSARGNGNREDVRVSFMPPFWAADSEPGGGTGEESPQTHFFFPVEVAQPRDGKRDPVARGKGRRRWYGRARSRHSLETCLSYVNYQREVLKRRRIYDPQGLAEALYHTGEQDEEIAEWLDMMRAGDRADSQTDIGRTM